MKLSLTLLAIGAAVATAQVSSLAQCGQTCLKNMIKIAQTDFGCAAGNGTCYCLEPKFAYGIRDCSNESCGSSKDAAAAIAYGNAYCKDTLAAASVSSNPAGTILSSAVATFSEVSAAASGTQLADSAFSAAATATVTSTPTSSGSGSVSSFASTITSSFASTITSSFVSTITSKPKSDLSSVVSSLSSAVSSASSALHSSSSSGSGSTSTETSSSSAASSTGNDASASTATSSAFAAPLQSAGPMLGAAAMAALMLF